MYPSKKRVIGIRRVEKKIFSKTPKPLTLPVPIPDEEKKPFEAPRRSVKIKIQVNFYFNATV